MGMPNPPIIKAGGFFALLAAFLAWYNALAGIADDSNRYDSLSSSHWCHSSAFASGAQRMVADLAARNLVLTCILHNSFFIIPVAHFPWSVTGLKKRGKLDATGENKTV